MEKEEVYASLNRAYFSDDCHEKELLATLPRLIRDARLFVDLGASLGQYTLAASRAMRAGRIVAVEADPIRHEELARNAARWSADGRRPIEAMFAAVSDRSGEAVFYSTQSNVSGGLFPHQVEQAVQWHEVRVPAVTLDELCGDVIPDFVKADIEGAEMRMLLGAQRILAARRTVFLLEVHPWQDPQAGGDVRAYLRSRGYWPAAFFGHTLFMPFGLDYLREKAAAGARRYLRRS